MKIALDDFTWQPAIDPAWESERLTATKLGKSYSPFRETTGLFRIFLDTEPTAEGMKGFVQKYGFPRLYSSSTFPDGTEGHGPVDLMAEHMAGDGASVPQGIFCTLEDFLSLQSDLRDAALLHEAVKTGDTDRAATVLKNHGNTAEGTPRTIDVLAAVLRASAVRHGGMTFLRESFRSEVNNKLMELGCSAALQLKDGTDWSLAFRPRSLIAAIWFQFALAVAEGTQFRNCVVCGRPFAVGGERKQHQARPDKIYCSEVCRVRSYQKREAEAKRKTPRPTKKGGQRK